MMQPPVRDHESFMVSAVSPVMECTDPHLTEQQHASECDATRLMQRYAAGQVPVKGVAPEYGARDLRRSYHDALLDGARLSSWYRSLSPEIRAKYPTPGHVLDAIAGGSLAFAADKSPPAASPAGSSGGGGGGVPAGAPPEGTPPAA